MHPGHLGSGQSSMIVSIYWLCRLSIVCASFFAQMHHLIPVSPHCDWLQISCDANGGGVERVGCERRADSWEEIIPELTSISNLPLYSIPTHSNLPPPLSPLPSEGALPIFRLILNWFYTLVSEGLVFWHFLSKFLKAHLYLIWDKLLFEYSKQMSQTLHEAMKGD